jgi:hypothetical protein
MSSATSKPLLAKNVAVFKQMFWDGPERRTSVDRRTTRLAISVKI